MKLLLAFAATLLLSCKSSDPKFVRKEINNKDINIQWYYYSYITSISPDFVVVKHKGKEKEIYKATRVITDVQVHRDSIILKLVNPSNGTFTEKVDNEVFGYKIFLDSTSTYEDLNKIPDGSKRYE
jgi:hypothetical protein